MPANTLPAVPDRHRGRPPDRRPALTRRSWLALGALWPLPSAAEERPARVLTVGPGAGFDSLARAVAHSVDGDRIEMLPGVYRGDVAVVERRRLSIRGLGDGVVLDAAGQHAAGKGILVVRGEVALENITFRGARAPDGNGAGVRFDHGRLSLRRCRFVDNEMGLLTGNDAASELEIEDCLFADAPRHPGLLHHLLYAGSIARLTVSGSRFDNGWRGHLLKSRARVNDIRYCVLNDGAQGGASYKLELAQGGHNLLLGNVLVQGPGAQNSTIVAIGQDADPALEHSLVMTHNTLVAAGGQAAVFLGGAWPHMPRLAPLQVLNNVFAGTGMLPAAVSRGANAQIALDALVAPASGDVRWNGACRKAASGIRLQPDWLPRREVTQPLGTRALAATGMLCAGALQPGR